MRLFEILLFIKKSHTKYVGEQTQNMLASRRSPTIGIHLRGLPLSADNDQ